MSLRQIGNAFSISQTVQVAAVLLAPAVFKRFGLISSIAYTQVATSLMLFALAASTHPNAATASYIGFTAFQWMNEPGLYSLLMNMVPEKKTSGASASNDLVISATQTLAATLAAGAFSRYGYGTTLRGIALIALVAAALFWSFRRHLVVNSSGIE